MTSLPGEVGAPAALSDAGGTYVAWARKTATAFELRVQRFLPDGSVAPGWPADAVLVSSVGNEGGMHGVHLVADGSGGAIVVWEQRDTYVPSPSNIFAQRVDGSGAVGLGWPQPYAVITSSPGFKTISFVHSDGNGGVYIGWLPDTSPYPCYLTRLTSTGQLAAGWNAGGNVITPSSDPPEISGASDGMGGTVVAWKSYAASDIYAVRILPGGTVAAGWNPAGVGVAVNFGQQGSPAIAPDGTGGAFISWDRFVGGVFRVFASHVEASGTFAPGVPNGGFAVAPGPFNQEGPQLLADGTGAAVAVWVGWHSATHSGLSAQRILAGGVDPSWPVGGLAIASKANTDIARMGVVSLSPDGLGGIFVAYFEDPRIQSVLDYDLRLLRLSDAPLVHDRTPIVVLPGHQTNAVSSTVGTDITVVFTDGQGFAYDYGGALLAQRLRADDPQSAMWNEVPIELCTVAGDQTAPALIADGAGGVIAAWADARNAATAPDIFARRITSTGGLPSGWSDFGAPVTTVSGAQSSPTGTSDGTGGAFIVWTDRRNGNLDLYGQRIQSDGATAPGWASNGVPLVVTAGSQTVPQCVSDGSGGAYVVWGDVVGFNQDVYALRVTGQGMPASGWPASGIAITSGPAIESGQGVVADGQGGIYVAWEDLRNSSTDIYAQHVLADGSFDPVWPAAGLPVCAASSTQYRVRLASDGAGGAYFAWQDFRSGNFDVYVQHLNADGTLAAGWVGNGIAVFSGPSDQTLAEVAAGESGALHVTWQDFRSGTSKVYAQKLQADASVAPGWSAGGVLVAESGGVQARQQVVSDAAGGAFIVFLDDASGTWQANAQHLDVSGAVAPGWPSSGQVVSSTVGEGAMTLMPDDAGGAIVVWQDRANSYDWDLHAQRLQPLGNTSSTGSTAGFLQASGYPNPFHRHVDIRFATRSAAPMRVEIFDVRGRLVRRLLDQALIPGPHVVRWNGFDAHGNVASAGAYFIRFSQQGLVEHRKVLRLR